jgi:PAS domain S-box-containing protein
MEPRSPAVLRSRLTRYGFAVIAVVLAFLLRKAIEPASGTGAPWVLLFGAILLTSILGGVGPGILASALSLPLGASFSWPNGFTAGEVAIQTGMFAIDATVIVYLSHLMMRARRAAERSAARVEALLDLAPDAVIVTGPDRRIIEVNRATCRLLRSERGELLGKTVRDLLRPEDVPRLDADRAALRASPHVITSEWEMRRRDGTFVPVEVSATLLADQRGHAFIRDISGRRRLDDERRVFTALLESSHDYIGIAGPDGRPLYINPAGRALIGITADFPVGQKHISDFFPEPERAVAHQIASAIEATGHWSGEVNLRNWQTGEPVPLASDNFLIHDATGARVLGRGIIAHDVTEARRAAREREALLASEREARHRAEAIATQLRESEERFRLTIDEAPTGIALCALDGRYVRVNEALCRLVGYSADELLTMHFKDITPPEDVDAELAVAARLLHGEVPFAQREKRYVRKDGAIVTTLHCASVLRDPAGAPICFIGQIQDITDRKRAERALAVSEARLSGVISMSTDAIVLVDDAQRITLFNSGAEKIFGYVAAEVLGEPLQVLLPERLRAATREWIAGFAIGPDAARAMGERGLLVGRRKGGEEFPVEGTISRLTVAGNLTITVALRDITERQRGERDRQFLAEAGASLVSLDPTETLEQLGRLAIQELADCCLLELVKPVPGGRRRFVFHRPEHARVAARLEAEPPVMPVVERAMSTRRPVAMDQLELGTLEAGGEPGRLFRELDARAVLAVPLECRGDLFGVMVLVSTSPARSYGTREVRLAQALADRAAMTIENGRLYETAIQATRLRDQVLGIVAHDLRNPLSVARMQLDRLRLEHPELSSKAIAAIERSTVRMTRLIEDLVDVTRLEAGELGISRARVVTRQLLADTMEAQQVLAARAGVELRLAPTGDLPEVWGDAQRLTQVLENLIGNAIKFTPTGGAITVGAVPRGDDVLLWVTDTGPGIAPEALPHIFERFWQVSKTTRTGAGLGLPIVRGIVEAHGGRIWVESEAGRGATFYFVIPTVPDAERTPLPRRLEH